MVLVMNLSEAVVPSEPTEPVVANVQTVVHPLVYPEDCHHLDAGEDRILPGPQRHQQTNDGHGHEVVDRLLRLSWRVEVLVRQKSVGRVYLPVVMKVRPVSLPESRTVQRPVNHPAEEIAYYEGPYDKEYGGHRTSIEIW